MKSGVFRTHFRNSCKRHAWFAFVDHRYSGFRITSTFKIFMNGVDQVTTLYWAYCSISCNQLCYCDILWCHCAGCFLNYMQHQQWWWHDAMSLCVACPPNHIQHQGSCYRIIPVNQKMFNSSSMFELHAKQGVCRNQASWGDTGHLATITSEDENTFYHYIGFRYGVVLKSILYSLQSYSSCFLKL
jgi:hypothetical protein